MAEAPVVETERLVLRPFRAGDLDAQAKAMRDPEVVRYLGGTPHAREDTWRRMLAAPGLWELLGYGYWAIERKADGAYLGQLGFADFKRDMTPGIEGLPEMGWILVPEAHGHGYAVEGVVAALDWADRSLNAPQIVAIIDHGNAASIRLAEKVGFDVREEATYRESPILLFRRER
ncbi:GNAT family N-acetyltransferase [Sphingosinicella sp. LHD-64]|uniref:GNAT family N-acetyltransferase n=1 Tax=Sphingosinicella sp. LHD-64 TaxID=3072139 RepID=UPI0028101562|nr:GNAT family N-acetyltransferase [Sphingosinicella sp. LHD-64]MDQ8754823.1 GNAT family N-acetyltransferase [Sphingosinicella sp. LHD-64]